MSAKKKREAESPENKSYQNRSNHWLIKPKLEGTSRQGIAPQVVPPKKPNPKGPLPPKGPTFFSETVPLVFPKWALFPSKFQYQSPPKGLVQGLGDRPPGIFGGTACSSSSSSSSSCCCCSTSASTSQCQKKQYQLGIPTSWQYFAVLLLVFVSPLV